MCVCVAPVLRTHMCRRRNSSHVHVHVHGRPVYTQLLPILWSVIPRVDRITRTHTRPQADAGGTTVRPATLQTRGEDALRPASCVPHRGSVAKPHRRCATRPYLHPRTARRHTAARHTPRVVRVRLPLVLVPTICHGSSPLLSRCPLPCRMVHGHAIRPGPKRDCGACVTRAEQVVCSTHRQRHDSHSPVGRCVGRGGRSAMRVESCGVAAPRARLQL